MGLIAIAVNPASGRDIRRFVSSATVFNNREKQNIVERIILAASQIGDHDFCIMPDSFHFAERIQTHLVEDLKCITENKLIDSKLTYSNSQKDTENFAKRMQELGAALLIVLGGDGTCRVAAKGIGKLPLIAISTGTNNVFPKVIEGTVAGMAAAMIASKKLPLEACTTPCKRIEIYKNNQFVDLALVDVVFSDYVYSGAKAIWNRDDITRVVVTQCHPASIGFSSIAGCRMIITPQEDYGAIAECGMGKPNTFVSLAAGVVTSLEVKEIRKIPLGQELQYQMDKTGILALDGEREVGYQTGDMIILRIMKNGPLCVDINKTLELAQQNQMFCI